MAALFTEGWIGEAGNNGALVGLRMYFGQRDKTLIRRHREDDPGVLTYEQLKSWCIKSNSSTGPCGKISKRTCTKPGEPRLVDTVESPAGNASFQVPVCVRF